MRCKWLTILFIISFFLFFSLPEDKVYSLDSSSSDNRKIMVLPFINIDQDMNLAYLSDAILYSINTALSRAETFQIVHFNQISYTIRSHGITRSQYTNPSALSTIGELLQVGYIISGSFEKYEEGIQISAKVFNVKRGATGYELFEHTGDSMLIFDIVDKISAGLLINFAISISNPRNYQYNFKPTFQWIDISGDQGHALYIDDQKIYEGNQSVITLENELEPGDHEFYSVINVSGESFVTDHYSFQLRTLHPAVMIEEPAEQSYEEVPIFKFNPVEGADHYKIFIDGQLVYQGPNTNYQPQNKLDFGTHTYEIVAINGFQSSTTGEQTFEINQLLPVLLVSPEYEEVFFSDTAQQVLLEWENRNEGITHEVFVNDQSIAITQSSSLVFDELSQEGKYTWYVVSKADSQRVESKSHEFYYSHILMKFGIRETSVLTVASNISGRYNFLINGGIAMEVFPIDYVSFELGANYGFCRIRMDGYEYNFISERSIIEYTYFSIPISIKPYLYYERWRFSAPIGINIELTHQTNLTIDHDDYSIDGDIRDYFFTPTIGFEFGYTFNDYLEIIVNIHYDLNFLSLTEKQKLQEYMDHRIGLTLGFNIFKI